MGFFKSIIGTYSVSTFLSPYIKKGVDWLKDSDFFKGIKSTVVDGVVNKVGDYVGDYASHIESDKWTEMVTERVSLDGLTDEQLDSYSDLANSFSNVMTKAGDEWSKISESIAENPAAWGVYLANHNVTNEKLAEMTVSIENGEGISGYDMLKLTWTNGSVSDPEKTTEVEASADAPTVSTEEESTEPTVVEQSETTTTVPTPTVPTEESTEQTVAEQSETTTTVPRGEEFDIEDENDEPSAECSV